MTDIMEQLGSLALGSRLRRVSDPLMYGTGKLYKSLSIDFEPRWFPVYSVLLQSTQAMTIGELAEYTGLTQPAVSQIMTQMVKRAWVNVKGDPQDARRRLFTLTRHAKQAEGILIPVWQAVRRAANELLDELEHPLFPLLNQLEEQLTQTPFHDRIRHHLTQSADHKEPPMIHILSYQPQYQPHFERLNREWLVEHFVVEPYDDKVLRDPDTYILQPGGSIYFAQMNDDPINDKKQGDGIVGTIALIPRGNGVVELSKMGVNKAYQAKGIGRKLAQYTIDQARTQGYHTIMLDSNTKLTPAIKLYRQLGFVEIPTDPDSPYERANIRMVIPLQPESPWFKDSGLKPSNHSANTTTSSLACSASAR